MACVPLPMAVLVLWAPLLVPWALRLVAHFFFMIYETLSDNLATSYAWQASLIKLLGYSTHGGIGWWITLAWFCFCVRLCSLSYLNHVQTRGRTALTMACEVMIYIAAGQIIVFGLLDILGPIAHHH